MPSQYLKHHPDIGQIMDFPMCKPVSSLLELISGEHRRNTSRAPLRVSRVDTFIRCNARTLTSSA